MARGRISSSFLLLLLLTALVLSQDNPPPPDDILLALPEDCIAAVVVPSLNQLADSIAVLARRLGSSHPVAGLPARWDRLPGLDLTRSAAVLLLGHPGSPVPSFAFVVPVTDYDTFLGADSAAEVNRLPNGVDVITRSAAGTRPAASASWAPRARSRPTSCPQPDTPARRSRRDPSPARPGAGPRSPSVHWRRTGSPCASWKA